jgi:hypothetical protein
MKLWISAGCAVVFLNACSPASDKEAALKMAKQAAIDSMIAENEKKALVDSMTYVMAQREEALKVQQQEEKSAVAASTATATTPQKKKKKWNNTAKGAVIGAGTGAVAGALIDKKRVEGALIGSVIGAGVGTATGAVIDGSQKKKKKVE